jgi:hypothetical protein
MAGEDLIWFEGDKQRVQVRLSDADNIINAESAKLSRKRPGPGKENGNALKGSVRRWKG